MTNLYKKIWIITLFGIFFSACSSSEGNDGGAGFILKSTSPTENEVVSRTIGSAELVFDQVIRLADPTKIRLNGDQAVASARGYSLLITLKDLDYSTKYTITVEKGAIKDASDLLNKEIYSLHFTTEKKPALTSNLVMPNASAQAKKVYQFLLDNYEKKIVSGVMARVNWNIEEAERVYRWTGKYPVLNGFDYGHHHFSPSNWIDYSNTKVVEDWWNNKGLVAITWHWNVPVSSGSSERAFYTAETSFDIRQALIEGTAENKLIKEDMDEIVSYLKLLQDKNIPVIWRPLHEASGEWFWWGAKGAEPCKKLWILMFDYFKAKGINNLIWVWTTSEKWGATKPDDDWYPGDAYVDIVGQDIYHVTDAAAVRAEYAKLKSRFPAKIIALSECGDVANISKQWAANAYWSWFMPWYDYDANDADSPANIHAGKTFWQDAFNCDKVISRDQMPSLK